MIQQPATPELEPLERFAGTWDTEGEVLAGEPGLRFEATDEYEWLPGGHFLVHKFHARMPDGETAGIELISYDPASNGYAMQSFDSSGSTTMMRAQHKGDRWQFLGDQMRFTGGFSPDGREFSGTWELRSGDAQDWQPWMSVRLVKRSRAAG